MTKISSPPGVFDLIPNDAQEPWKNTSAWQYVEKIARNLAELYGLREIRTPLFEKTELFQRSVGEATDIVNKEMYTFEDRGGRSLSLRPEGTAPVIRAFVEHRLDLVPGGNRLFYIAPMFRYERSQKGRYRQHHQFGVEVLGAHDPEQDVEVIDLLYSFYRRLGLSEVTLCLNTIGDQATRTAYREALVDYLLPHRGALSPESQQRLETNPIRILDSKNEDDQALLAEAPAIHDFLKDQERTHFETVCSLLDQLEVPYQISQRLVRGLDYYSGTVFEFVVGQLGAQNSIGGGGRYDGLVHTLGGPPLAAIGFGTGLERVIQTMLAQGASFGDAIPLKIVLLCVDEVGRKAAPLLLHRLRSASLPAELDFNRRKLGRGIQWALEQGGTHVLILGEGELQSEKVVVKTLATEQQCVIGLDECVAYFKKISQGGPGDR